MGQTEHKQAAEEGLEGVKKGTQKQFLDFYDVGDRLGEGSFGVVYKCNPKGDKSKDYAVKMVDKVETPAAQIIEEAEFMRVITHPNIVKCHDVINEKCFVCIVVDLYIGGDMIVCMQKYWQKGKIPFGITLNLTYQMASSLEYIHAKRIIHRDVKADNYLCDRSDLGDPDIRIILTDFGTAKNMTPGERFHERTGTKLYWSPEFWLLDYSLPVDVFAVGVVTYGLLCGSFPFKNKAEVNNKVLKWPSKLPPVIQEIAQGLLARNENKRLKAADVTAHPALAEVKAKATSAGSDVADDPLSGSNFREVGANDAIKERRAELLSGIVDGGTASMYKVVDATGGKHYINTAFRIFQKKDNQIKTYEWFDAGRAEGVVNGVAHLAHCHSGADAALRPLDSTNVQTTAATISIVGQMLTEHDIDINKFGKGGAKTLDKLAAEVTDGSARLLLDATNYKKLVRVTELVAVRIYRVKNGVKEYAIETEEKAENGSERATNRMPGAKKAASENCMQTVERVVDRQMNLRGKVRIDYAKTVTYDKEEMSPSYPGVYTVYKSQLVEGCLVDAADTSANQWSFKGDENLTRMFEWLSEAECNRRHIQVTPPAKSTASSALVDPPLGFDEEQLESFLESNKVVVSTFGKGQAHSLADFANEMVKGDSTLMMDRNKRLVRVVDVVLMKLVSKRTGKVLVQTDIQFADKSTKKLDRLPGMKKRPDENAYITAKKVITKTLCMDENDVIIDPGRVEEFEDEQASVNYPGLPTVYHKRIITATLLG